MYVLLLFAFRYSLFDNVVDSRQVTTRRAGSSRSSHSSRRSVQEETLDVIRLRQELQQQQERQRAQEEYMREFAQQQDFYSNQFVQQQTLIQVSNNVEHLAYHLRQLLVFEILT